VKCPQNPFVQQPDRASWLVVVLGDTVVYRGQVLVQGDARCGRRHVCEHNHVARWEAQDCAASWLEKNPCPAQDKKSPYR
jgi:hypothetical protein